MIYDGLFQRLAADAGVANIVAVREQVDEAQRFALAAFDDGTATVLALDADSIATVLLQGPPPRIWPMVIPQSDAGQQRVPCIVYQTINRERQVTYCGTAGLARTQQQLDAYARTYNGAQALARAIEACLVDFRGLMGGYLVQQISLTNEIDLMDPEPGLYRVSMDFEIWHQRQPQ